MSVIDNSNLGTLWNRILGLFTARKINNKSLAKDITINDEDIPSTAINGETTVEGALGNIADQLSNQSQQIGDLTDLETTVKTDLVSAVNENTERIDSGIPFSSGVWTCIKNGSGMAECMATFTNQQMDITQPWGNLYITDGEQITFPIGLFIDAPIVSINISSSVTAFPVITTVHSNYVTFYCCRPGTGNATANFIIHAIGRWK